MILIFFTDCVGYLAEKVDSSEDKITKEYMKTLLEKVTSSIGAWSVDHPQFRVFLFLLGQKGLSEKFVHDR